MGFKKSWDIPDIVQQIHSASRECNSSYNDGFTSFEIKKELYLISEVIQKALATAPNFGDMEQQWLTEQEQKRIIKHLKS